MEGFYQVVPTEEKAHVPTYEPNIAYDVVHDIIKIDGIPFAAEFFFFLTHELHDGDLFEITRRGGAISLRKVELMKP